MNKYFEPYLNSIRSRLGKEYTLHRSTLYILIGILAIYTGLRGCDIAGLTLDAIDWNRDFIYIRQQKTEIPLELPLTAIVGNAI